MPTFGDPGNRRVVQDVDPAEIRYAWFSKKMCVASGGEVTLYEMEDGAVKEVTCVSTTSEQEWVWDDLQFLGKTTTSGYRGRKLAMLFLKKNEEIKVALLDSLKNAMRDVPRPTSGEVLYE